MTDRLNLAQYKKTLTDRLRQATLCFLAKDKQVLLAMKKRGFAKGKWNGAGGKAADGDKNIKATAIRETEEEIGVIPKSLKQMANLNFYFPANPEWSQQVIVFLVRRWEREPQESEEMAPKWFDFDKIPYNEMWEDDIFWLPQVLKGKGVEADFLFDENQKMLEYRVREL